MTNSATLPPLTPQATMREVLSRFPGAQRALFARYHIGGCQSCGFQPTETIAQLCERNENLPVQEVIAHIVDSHDEDSKLLVEPHELKSLLESADPPRLVDIRTREEFEAVQLKKAYLFSQDFLNLMFSEWPKEAPIIVYDHTGSRSLDAAAYLIGHGFGNVKCLRGGIDRYAESVDTSLPRYKIEIDE
ncbi:MAG: rhodanese-like domain-containing protein [Verrucomicrobiota bacterium]